jgi:tetratricopeptide (TPR) repeat protein
LLAKEQLDAAEEAGLRAMKLFLNPHREFWICISHRLLGNISRKRGKREKAIQHFEAAISIASSFNWHEELFWTHNSLAWLFYDEDEFDNAQSHVDQAKSHAVDDAYCLCRAMDLQARIWYRQWRLKEAKAEVLCALETFEKFGATREAWLCRDLLRLIQQAAESLGDSDSNGKFFGHDALPVPVNPIFSTWYTAQHLNKHSLKH